MPHLSGVFDQFPGLEKASPEQLSAWISQKLDAHFLNNYLGNRLLYPQAIPLSLKEMEIDFAILRAAIRLKPGLVFEPQTNRIIIPTVFVDRFPPLRTLVLSIIEGISPKGMHFIYVRAHPLLKMVGSVIGPLNPQKLSQDGKTVSLSTEKIKAVLPLNRISVVDISTSEDKVMLGNQEFKALGGELGIIVDLRGGFG